VKFRPRHGLILGWRVVPASQVSLRARVGLLAFAAVVLGAGVAVGGGYYFAQRELHQEVDQFLERRARSVSNVVQRPGELGLRHRGALPFIGRIALADFDAHIQILDSSGRPTFAITDVRLPVGSADRQIATDGGDAVRRTVHIEGKHYRLLTVALDDGAVQVARDLGETDRVLNDLLRRTIPLGALLAVLAAGMAWLLARRALRPVEQLTRAAEYVAATKDLTGSINATRDDEVGRLARSFTAMLEALQASRRQQQQLVADAGHELRTPLTSISTNIELLARADSLDDDERRRILADVSDELAELGTIVGELLELAGEPATVEEPLTTFDLADLAIGAAERARRRTGRDIATETGHRELVRGRRGLLERAIDNLLGNATKFSAAGTPIRIVTTGGRVDVQDAGPGIPAEDQPLVFERFFRSAAARAQPGSGLGLAIVKQTIEHHGGHVWAGVSPMGGASVGFEIPTGEPDAP
jgi:two-component system sensor histidine kinase MprB